MTAAAFITGIGGQDGGYLAERLVADGMEVHALVLATSRSTKPSRNSTGATVKGSTTAR